jgi:thioredoxin-like negative regulator of GroEL
MMKPVDTHLLLKKIADFNVFIQQQPICLVYFSAPGCSVCGVLKPKLFEMLTMRFSALAIAEVDCAQSPELAAQLGVFAVPTVLLYVDARENLRRTRSFSPLQIADALARPYALLMGDS